jgi:hypothetical protein
MIIGLVGKEQYEGHGYKRMIQKEKGLAKVHPVKLLTRRGSCKITRLLPFTVFRAGCRQRTAARNDSRSKKDITTIDALLQEDYFGSLGVTEELFVFWHVSKFRNWCFL